MDPNHLSLYFYGHVFFDSYLPHHLFYFQGLFWLHAAHLSNTGNAPHLKVLHLITCAKSSFPMWDNVSMGSRDWGIDILRLIILPSIEIFLTLSKPPSSQLPITGILSLETHGDYWQPASTYVPLLPSSIKKPYQTGLVLRWIELIYRKHLRVSAFIIIWGNFLMWKRTRWLGRNMLLKDNTGRWKRTKIPAINIFSGR